MKATAIPKLAAETNSSFVHLPCARSRRAEKISRINAALMTRSHATLAGASLSNKLKAITAPMYWAVAEQIKNNSGGNAPIRADAEAERGAGLLTRTVRDLTRKFLETTAETETNQHRHIPSAAACTAQIRGGLILVCRLLRQATVLDNCGPW